jgi:restriction endonuclease-like protein
LFPASHAAIADWNKFPWHRRNRVIQTSKPESSQALAIDVFGTIKVSGEIDRILGALAQKCGLPADGPWSIELEWRAPKDLLGEPRPTQVDAIACGSRSSLVFECKFTEPGGGCSQPQRIPKGAHRGKRQCDGNYALQINPARKSAGEARCALIAKKVRYWESIPKLFGIDAEQDYRPCPFAGEGFQWMRNVVLADKVAAARGVRGAVIAAFADADPFQTAQKARSGVLGGPAFRGQNLIIPLSYQAIVGLANSVSDHPDE